MNRLQTLAIAFLSLLVASLTSAQTISVRTLALRADPLPEVYLQGPKGHHALSFSATQPDEAVQVVAANPLPLYTSGLDSEGKEAFVVAQTVKVPAGAKGILLLAWKSDEETRYVAINDDFATARFNDWLLINAGVKPIAFSVGENSQPAVIAPGAAMTHRIEADKGKGAAVLAQAPFKGKAKTFFSTYWPVHADKRTIVIFVDDGSKIRVKRISDKLAPAKSQSN
jgi:hypothetical protein